MTAREFAGGLKKSIERANHSTRSMVNQTIEVNRGLARHYS